METTVTQHKSDSSIEITKTSRGMNYAVKAYGQDEAEIKQKLDNLLKMAKEITDEQTSPQQTP